MYYAIEIALGILAVVLLLVTSVKVFREYERGILFRLGRLGGIKGPGLVFIFPLIDRLIKADLRLVSIDVPRQEIMTRDNVPVTVDAVIYFQIIRPALAITVIENYYNSTFLIAQTTLRSVLGQSDLDELLSQRDIINQKLQAIIDKQTDPWGIKVPMEEMKRAMAKQAEAERERRARIIEAEGEFQAAAKLVDAANIMSKNPISIQLRYLKTLSDISGRQGNTIVFPSPVDLLSPLIKKDNPKPTGDK
jgi:regulator of protease activity HflC (stomatin/prohibitin superfamily)